MSVKPKIFISSTIYDFKDLRSSMKYWLESLGYEVMLSEYNDFTKPLDENSYNACFNTIGSCDYFILLIGNRVGGLYNKIEKISVTRQEYRIAYGLAKSKKIKLVTFIRKDIWDIREDRRALSDLLKQDYQEKLEKEEIENISNHQSTFVNDAELTFSFIKEVTRANEMKQAIQGKGEFPIGNWTHQFNTFQDIVDVLQTELKFSQSLSREALSRNLKREIKYNLSLLTEELEGGVGVITYYGTKARHHFKGSYTDYSEIPREELVSFIFFYLDVVNSPFKLSVTFTNQALISGEFLDFDSSTNSYQLSLVHNALFHLQEHINRLKELQADYKARRPDLMNKYLTKLQSPQCTKIRIFNLELATPFAIYNCHQNIIRLCLSILKALDGNNERLLNLKILPPSPFEKESKNLQHSWERVNVEDVERWMDEIEKSDTGEFEKEVRKKVEEWLKKYQNTKINGS